MITFYVKIDINAQRDSSPQPINTHLAMHNIIFAYESKMHFNDSTTITAGLPPILVFVLSISKSYIT